MGTLYLLAGLPPLPVPTSPCKHPLFKRASDSLLCWFGVGVVADFKPPPYVMCVPPSNVTFGIAADSKSLICVARATSTIPQVAILLVLLLTLSTPPYILWYCCRLCIPLSFVSFCIVAIVANFESPPLMLLLMSLWMWCPYLCYFWYRCSFCYLWYIANFESPPDATLFDIIADATAPPLCWFWYCGGLESPPYVTLGIVANSESPHLCCPTGVPHRPSGNTFTIVAYFESSPLCYFWYCIVACCGC